MVSKWNPRLCSLGWSPRISVFLSSAGDSDHHPGLGTTDTAPNRPTADKETASAEVEELAQGHIAG